MNNLNCQQCNGVMVKKSEAAQTGMGCLLLVIGIILCFTGIGALIGIPVILVGLWLGSKKKGWWVCKNCGYKISRHIKWYEFG